MYRAIYVCTGAYDAVVTENGIFPVDKQVLYHFLNAPSLNKDFSNWGGGRNINRNNNDNIWDVAKNMGKIVAYYKDDTLHVHDENLWKKRMLFWSSELGRRRK